MSETNASVTSIAALPNHLGETVTLRGWLYNIRSSGKLLFPTFRDGSGTVQGIVPKAAVAPELFESHQDTDAGIKRNRDRQSASRQAGARRL